MSAEERIAHLKKQIRTVERKGKVGDALVVVGAGSISTIMAVAFERALEKGLAALNQPFFYVLILIGVATLLFGLCLRMLFANKLKTLREELAKFPRWMIVGERNKFPRWKNAGESK